MSLAIVSGSAGLIGAETCKRFHQEGFDLAGIDNDMRREFFGPDASTLPSRRALEDSLKNYRHFALDIRDREAVAKLFSKFGTSARVVIHTAAPTAAPTPLLLPLIKRVLVEKPPAQRGSLTKP